jgi:hypothetical protein
MDAVVNAAAAQVGLIMVASLFVLLGVVELIERIKNRPVKQPVRAAARIPEREMQLVGDDYRDHVRAYFGIRERRRQIVQEVCRERH